MTTLDPVDLVASRLKNVSQTRDGFSAACPVSGCPYRVSVNRGDDGRALLHCVAGHGAEEIAPALGLKLSDLFVPNGREGEGGYLSPSKTPATMQPPSPGLTVAQFAQAKRLDPERLRAWGLSDVSYLGTPAVRIPYFDAAGVEVAVRFRLALDKGEGDDRFRWKKGSRAVPFGQSRLLIARERNFVVVVEGESDALTFWAHNVPSIGIPGAGCWQESRDAPLLDGIDTIYVMREPDSGGTSLIRRFAPSVLRDRIRVVTLEKHKDASELHVADPASFMQHWETAKNAAVPLTDLLIEQAKAAAAAAWDTCQALAREPDILDRAAATVARLGVAGEITAVKLVYLAVTSRLLARPVSVALKGPSSAGKSYLVEQVLKLFPAESFYALTAMSERALAYSDEPLRHRMLVLYEAAGMSGDMASYLIRSLLSEGRLSYETVEKTKDGLKARHIVREGPTGLIVTTTAIRLHPENETRLLSIPVSDTAMQTKAVFRSLANGSGIPPDVKPWHAIQTWLAGGPTAVTILFADALAELMSPRAVRLRRDFGLVLTLIRAHAVLHRADRDVDDAGRIVATLDDYENVRELVEPLIASGIEATVPATMRETVTAVADLCLTPEQTATVVQIGKALKLDKSAAWRRVRAAIEQGYLINKEERKGRPAKLALGDALPEDSPILPDGCTVAGVLAGVKNPSPNDVRLP